MLPHLAKVADDIAIVRSMHTEQFNHAPAQIFVNTGVAQLGRPSMGSWISYGLGTENADLPAFVVLQSAQGHQRRARPTGAAAFCRRAPGRDVPLARAIRFCRSPIPTGIDRADAARLAGPDPRSQRAACQRSSTIRRSHTRISAYELAYRMQTSAPELTDLSKESKETLEMYGAKPGEASFANNCLLARRLVERGVRFVKLYHEAWDHHTDVAGGLKKAVRRHRSGRRRRWSRT